MYQHVRCIPHCQKIPQRQVLVVLHTRQNRVRRRRNAISIPLFQPGIQHLIRALYQLILQQACTVEKHSKPRPVAAPCIHHLCTVLCPVVFLQALRGRLHLFRVLRHKHDHLSQNGALLCKICLLLAPFCRIGIRFSRSQLQPVQLSHTQILNGHRHNLANRGGFQETGIQQVILVARQPACFRKKRLCNLRRAHQLHGLEPDLIVSHDLRFGDHAFAHEILVMFLGRFSVDQPVIQRSCTTFAPNQIIQLISRHTVRRIHHVQGVIFRRWRDIE